jgi:hypothetical protein
LLLVKMVKLINAIRSLPGITDKPGLRESISLLRALTNEGRDDVGIDEIELHLCFLARRRLDLENLRKSLARIEVMMEGPNEEVERWVDELEEVAR